jgi:hypothetical protein
MIENGVNPEALAVSHRGTATTGGQELTGL